MTREGHYKLLRNDWEGGTRVRLNLLSGIDVKKQRNETRNFIKNIRQLDWKYPFNSLLPLAGL